MKSLVAAVPASGARPSRVPRESPEGTGWPLGPGAQGRVRVQGAGLGPGRGSGSRARVGKSMTRRAAAVGSASPALYCSFTCPPPTTGFSPRVSAKLWLLPPWVRAGGRPWACTADPPARALLVFFPGWAAPGCAGVTSARGVFLEPPAALSTLSSGCCCLKQQLFVPPLLV